MRSIAFLGASAGLLVAAAAQADVTVNPGDSAVGPNGWEGFMNVFNLPDAPVDPGAFQFASGWGVPDLVAIFDDPAGKITMEPNQVNDPNEYWYQNTSGTAPDPANPGGPGQAGNKIMEANMFRTWSDDPAFTGTNVTFEGTILANTFTDAHVGKIFIRDFAPDFSTFNETIVDATPGVFSLSLATDPGLGRHIQMGFQVTGVNVWAGDQGPFGNLMIATVPAPGTFALLGLGGAAMIRRRR